MNTQEVRDRLRAIPKPHREQDGWRYERTSTDRPTPLVYAFFSDADCGMRSPRYDDSYPESRIISSRRTEAAVEQYDILALCREYGINVEYSPCHARSWAAVTDRTTVFANTLRGAVERLLDAIEGAT